MKIYVKNLFFKDKLITVDEIEELKIYSEELQLKWINNLYWGKDSIGNAVPYVNCIFFDTKEKKDISIKIFGSYLPLLIPGSKWIKGKYTGNNSKQYSITLTANKNKMQAAEIEEKTGLRRLFHWQIKKKGFLYIDKGNFTITSENIEDDFKGLIIPKSSIAAYYFIYSDNMFTEIISNPGASFNAFDSYKSKMLTDEEKRRCIYLHSNTPLHDGAFWCRILHDDLFQSEYKKMRNEFYVELKYSKDHNTYSDAHIESNFPDESEITINAYCKIVNNYLILDAISKQEYEWEEFSDCGVYKDEKGQTTKDKDISELEDAGTALSKIGEETNDSKFKNELPADSILPPIKKYITNSLRDERPPKLEKINSKDQQTFKRHLIEDIGEIQEMTLNPNTKSNTNVQKIDIFIDTKADLENKNDNGDELNSIQKILFIKHSLDEICSVESSRFIVNFTDPHNDHPKYVNVFPPMHIVSRIRDVKQYKWMSTSFVPKSEAVSKRKPASGYGVYLRGVAILEIKVEKGFFYLIEIEPYYNQGQREFKTYLANTENFKMINDGEIRTLLNLISRCEGVYNEEIFSKSVLEVNTHKFSHKLSPKNFAELIVLWIDSIA